LLSGDVVASIVAKQGDLLVEVGLIGCEGMTGSALILGADQAVNATFVQIAGEGNTIAASDILAAMNKSESMRALFLKYVQVIIQQTSQRLPTRLESCRSASRAGFSWLTTGLRTTRS
jgi:hypothetical protein